MSPWWTPSTSVTTWPLQAWDEGIEWQDNLVTPATDLALEVSYVRDKVLRVVNGSEEDEHIEALILAVTGMAEEATQRALMPQTREIVLSGLPTGFIKFPRAPFIEVTDFAYLDEDGNSQTLALSPPDFQVVPSGTYQKAKLLPLTGASWPTLGAFAWPVTIKYRCGFELYTDPLFATIRIGMELAIGELYKQRSLSVQAISGSVPAELQLDRFWRVVY